MVPGVFVSSLVLSMAGDSTASPFAASYGYLGLTPEYLGNVVRVPLEELDNEFHFSLNAFYEDVEFDKIRRDVVRAQFGSRNSTKLDEIDVNGDRLRGGVEARFGTEVLTLGLAVFQERFEFESNDEFDLYGGRVSLEGTPTLADWGSVDFILDYGAEYSYARGDGHVQFQDQSSTFLFDVDGDVDYYNYQVHLGAGIEVAGLQVSAGALFDVMSGLIDLELDDDMEFEGGNFGGYARVAWVPAELPFFACARVFAGEYSGFAAALGFRF